MISIVVPVYNVEKYLERCIDSILEQTFEDFEILLVDDGSKDSSGSICDELAKKDKRLRVFHKSNGGLSDARNYGLERIRGDYVTFIDSDDFIGKNYLKTLMDQMVENNADISMISSAAIYDDDPVPEETEGKCYVMDGKTAFKVLVCREMLSWSAWGKLFKKSIVKELRFPKGYCYEDLHTIPYLISNSSIFAYCSKVEYYYIQRRDSIMHVVTLERIKMWEKGIDKLQTYIKENCPENTMAGEAQIINGIFDNYIDFLLDNKLYKKVARHMKKKYKYELQKSYSNTFLGRKRKLNAILFMLNSDLYRLAKKVWLEIKPDSNDKRNRKLVEIE